MAKQGGHNLKWETREIIRLMHSGWPDRAIIERMKCTTSALVGIRSRLKSGMYAGLTGQSIEPSPSTTPSAATLRLAEFDPIIARAIRQRNGEEP